MTWGAAKLNLPGIGIELQVQHEWRGLGRVLASGTSVDQAKFLDVFGFGLNSLGPSGDMQLQYIADEISGEPHRYDKSSIIWLLRGLLERLEES